MQDEDIEDITIFRNAGNTPFIHIGEFWLRCYERVLPRCIKDNENDQEAVDHAARIAYLSVKKVFGPF